MAEVIPFSFDSFLLCAVEDLTPERTQKMRDDYKLATNVMLYCQTQRMLALRGEMTSAERFKLKYALAMILDKSTLG